jgi:hypothetical protein
MKTIRSLLLTSGKKEEDRKNKKQEGQPATGSSLSPSCHLQRERERE